MIRLKEGEFSPATWCVTEPFTEEEYTDALKSFGLEPISDRIGFVRNDPLKIKLPESLIDRSLNIMRIREHEWTHFRQHISTPLGLFYFRLHGLREYAILSFFQELNNNGMPYPDMPFYIMHEEFKKFKDTHYKHLYSFLSLWHISRSLEGVLLYKTTTLKNLIRLWNTLKSFNKTNVNFANFLDEGVPELLSKNPLDEMSCPDGHIRVIDLIEGHAKFREIWGIIMAYSPEHALKFLPDENSLYGRADKYFRTHFNKIQIPLHPLSGALQEIALLCFKDPFMCPEEYEYYWEDNCPGLRFEEAVKKLSNSLRTIPDKIEDIYNEALKAYNMESPFSPETLNWITTNLRDIKNIGDLKQEDLQRDWKGTLQHFYKAIFLKALQLRTKYPSIYLEVRSFDMETFQEFASLTRPPFFQSPETIYFSHGADRDISLSVGLAFEAFNSYSLNEIANDANFNKAVQYARKNIYNSNVPLIDDLEIKKRILKNFGPSLESKINNALRLSES